MRKLTITAAACALALGVATSAQNDAIKAAADALGAASIKTLQFTGSGANFSVGQNYTPGEPWPRVTVKSYTASINYDTGSMRQELVREMGTTHAARRRRAVHRRAAADPGRQRRLRVERGGLAAPGCGAAPTGRRPAPGNAVERMLTLWATPQGFVKAAMANNATTKKAKGGTEVSFTVGGKYKMTGIINAQNQVERVQTWIDQPDRRRHARRDGVHRTTRTSAASCSRRASCRARTAFPRSI